MKPSTLARIALAIMTLGVLAAIAKTGGLIVFLWILGIIFAGTVIAFTIAAARGEFDQ